MARDFNGTTDHLSVLFGGITGTPFSIACWFNADNAAAGQILVYVGRHDASEGWWLGASGDQPGDPVIAVVITGGPVVSFAVSTTGYTLGTWHHACAVFNSATSRSAYIDGGSEGSNTEARAPTTPASAVYIGTSGVLPAPFDGRIAEVGIWDVSLTAPEIATLADGVSPIMVRPESLKAYWPIIGRASPDIELINGTSVNVMGTPAPAAHCRIIYPAAGYVSAFEVPENLLRPPRISNPFSVFAPSVSVETPSLTLAPPLVSNAFQVFAPAVSVTAAPGTVLPPVISNPFTVYAPTVNLEESTIQEDERELEPHNLRVRIVDFVGGDDLRITRTYTELEGGITITKAYLTIKRLATDLDADATIQKTITSAMSSSGEITDDDTTGGSIALYFDLTGSETAMLTPLVPYAYDVQVITIGHAVYTCEKGVIVMNQGVTAATS